MSEIKLTPSYFLVESRDNPSDGRTLNIFIREDNARGFANDWEHGEKSKPKSKATVTPLFTKSDFSTAIKNLHAYQLRCMRQCLPNNAPLNTILKYLDDAKNEALADLEQHKDRS